MGTTAEQGALLPFRMKKADEWMPKNEENRMTDKKKVALLFRASKYCSSPVLKTRLSQRSTQAFKILKDSSHNKMDGHGVAMQPNYSSYVTASGDSSYVTVSTLSSSTASSDDKTKSVSDDNTKTSATDRASSPFHDHLVASDTKSVALRRAKNQCDVFAEEPKKHHQLCRSPSPMHERLARHETYATASQRSTKPVPRPAERPFYAFVGSSPRADIKVSSISNLSNSSPLPSRVSPPVHAKMRAPSPIQLAMLHTGSSGSMKSAVKTLRAPSPRPFYTLVTNGSFTGRGDISKMTAPEPTPTRQARQSFRIQHDEVDTRAQPDADDARTRFRLPNPIPLSPTGKSRGVSTAKEQKRKALQDKQNALYHRLASLDTVASSRMKPIPLKQRYLFPSEKKQISQAERNKTPIKRNQVYARLISRGSNAAIKMQIHQASTKYENEHDTFAESCENFLMRKFEGSTFVRV